MCLFGIFMSILSLLTAFYESVTDYSQNTTSYVFIQLLKKSPWFFKFFSIPEKFKQQCHVNSGKISNKKGFISGFSIDCLSFFSKIEVWRQTSDFEYINVNSTPTIILCFLRLSKVFWIPSEFDENKTIEMLSKKPIYWFMIII